MIGKLIFIALLLVFGAAMFMAGMWAPETVRGPVSSGLSKVLPATALPGARPSGPNLVTSGTPSGQEATTDQETPPPRYDTLLPPVPPPEPGDYVIQLGLYASGEAADALAAKAARLGLETAQVEVVDRHAEHWIVLIAGSFKGPAEAQGMQVEWAQMLNLPPPLPLLLLPPPPPPAGS
ncbi:MAG: hypothetical protein COX57_10410 [Alphaproteobacteria bacterium CG_4_10_14_0_2_um_filter_63_37]|nr:MAG: hypothetical protein AUJ55_00535 [Proteobacteria bacterium CG1_02_64_396]PJA23993.1 MAG: hypothetical protein COX57_10410 [Alphaproteobacteria bacterium CG_4_10_14_0_2_um_filter_63_37]